MAVCLLSVSAAVSRTTSGSTVTYSTTMATNYPRAYYVVYDVVPSGCTVNSVSCSTSNAECGYYTPDRSIRVVGYTSEAGGSLPTSVSVSVSGSGSCSLNNGQYAESYNTGSSSNIGSITNLVGTPVLQLSADCTALRSSALTSITSWASNPTSANKNTALSAITAWAMSC